MEELNKPTIKEIERLIHKTYRKELWRPFVKAIQEYELVENGDRVAIAISGGKDSLLLAKMMQMLQRTKIIDFSLEFIAMDPGFSKENREILENACKQLGIPVKIHESEIFKIVDTISKDYPCYMCARMRRGNLYAKAVELGCNKLALGHHMDDVVETVLLNVFYGGKFETMLPILDAQNFDSIKLIRPLYDVEEKEVIRFTNRAQLHPMNCGCVVAAQKTSSKRREMKQLVDHLYKSNKDVKKSIISSTKNVNLSKILGFKQSDLSK